MTQAQKFQMAKDALRRFEEKHGNRLHFPSTERDRRLVRNHEALQDVVARMYWTDEMDKAIDWQRREDF